MVISYRPYEPQQEMLLPASLQDWLPKGHLAYFISDSVDALDLNVFYAHYAGGGARNQPFHPALMVKLLVGRFLPPTLPGPAGFCARRRPRGLRRALQGLQLKVCKQGVAPGQRYGSHRDGCVRRLYTCGLHRHGLRHRRGCLRHAHLMTRQRAGQHPCGQHLQQRRRKAGGDGPVEQRLRAGQLLGFELAHAQGRAKRAASPRTAPSGRHRNAAARCRRATWRGVDMNQNRFQRTRHRARQVFGHEIYLPISICLHGEFPLE